MVLYRIDEVSFCSLILFVFNDIASGVAELVESVVVWRFLCAMSCSHLRIIFYTINRSKRYRNENLLVRNLF